jgi:hypothetical protein
LFGPQDGVLQAKDAKDAAQLLAAFNVAVAYLFDGLRPR